MSGAAPPEPPPARRPFVLVHGGFHGAWCWRKVRPLLTRAGHEVFTPSLTGLGDRTHLLSASINLETHLQDVIGVLESEDLREVVLVGHSYGGLVVTGAADRVPERVRVIVLLDSLTPVAGKSYLDHLPAMRSWVEAEGWKLTAPGPTAFGVTDPADQAFMAARLSAHPAATLKDPLPLSGRYASLPRIHLMSSHADADEAVRSRASGWGVRIVPGPHDLMIERPLPLAQALVALARA